MKKAFWKSKTIWVNIIVAIILGFMGVDIGLDPQMEIALLALVNIVLRILSDKGIALS